VRVFKGILPKELSLFPQDTLSSFSERSWFKRSFVGV